MIDTFGSRLRSARQDAGLTQLELSKGLMTTSHLSLLERDLRRPSVDAVRELATRLAVPAAQLSPGLALAWRSRPECRLEQADRAIRQCNYSTAERLATSVISSHTNGDRRMQAYQLRARAREGQCRYGSALHDLDLALGIAQLRPDSRVTAHIAIDCARLRLQLHADDAA